MSPPALYRLGAGVLALHVADDAFLQPQPGTSAGDHLAAGLIPLALLAVAAWAFARLPGSWRGLLAIGTGVLGAVLGVEAVHYLRTTGLAGDDYTGLLAAASGVGLVALGGWTLWTTRRRTGKLAWRLARRGLLVVAAYLGFAYFLWPVGYAYVTTHVARAEVPPPDLGAPHEHAAFTTSDGLELRGWYVPSRNGAAVIVFPGRKGPQRQARMLVRHGYGVLLFDRRGEGESEGDPNAWGWGGHRDVDAAIEFLRSRPDVDDDRIAGIGLSVGGEMMLEAAADNPRLAAVVAEGAGARSAAEEISDLEGTDKLEGGPMFRMMFAGVSVFSGQGAPENLEALLPRIAPRPVFLINAEHGEVGDKYPEYFSAAREPKRGWLVPRGGHTGAIDAMPAEYERRVVGFLDEAIGS